MNDVVATREHLVRELTAFLRYLHRIPAYQQPMTENWDARGPTVWMVFTGVKGEEHRYGAPLIDFEDWMDAR